jgi:carboxypeptidase Q
MNTSDSYGQWARTAKGPIIAVPALAFLLAIIGGSSALGSAADDPAPVWPQALVKEGLRDLQAHRMLAELTAIGGRRGGSPEAARAVEWGRQTMKRLGLENVRLEPVRVERWVRGKQANCRISGEREPLAVCALGGSVGTPRGGVEAEVVEVRSLKEAEELGPAGRGKIVFFNRPMDPTNLRTFASYGGAVDQRGSGAASAAKSGAVAVLVRSMTLAKDDAPHTGAMRYEEGVPKIPAGALSTLAADRLSERLKQEPRLRVRLDLDCRMEGEVDSANVVGEWRGSEKPDEVVLLGAHLDSWDLGQGAHDDGAGCVHMLEAVRLLKASGFRPKRTIRVVLFMDEEFGGRGGEAYAAAHQREKHIAAVESDDGGFMPRAIGAGATGALFERIKSWQPLLSAAGVERVSEGGGGADIGPLEKQGTILFGLEPDNQRYFDVHHSRHDSLEAVHPRELELGAAAMAILARLLSEEAL